MDLMITFLHEKEKDNEKLKYSLQESEKEYMPFMYFWPKVVLKVCIKDHICP